MAFVDDDESSADFPRCECMAQTKDGRRVLVRGPFGEAWISQEHIHDDSEVSKPGDKGKLVVVYWLAEARGWL